MQHFLRVSRCFRERSKMVFWRRLGRLREAPGASWGRFSAAPRRSGALLGPVGAFLGASEELRGALEHLRSVLKRTLGAPVRFVAGEGSRKRIFLVFYGVFETVGTQRNPAEPSGTQRNLAQPTGTQPDRVRANRNLIERVSDGLVLLYLSIYLSIDLLSVADLIPQ